MATFDEFIRSLEGASSEANKGKKFEVFCKWFLETHWSVPASADEARRKNT